MGARLTDHALIRAAETLGCEVAAIKAVISVEASGAGFLPDGRPKILFERHLFYKSAVGAAKFAVSDPDICSEHPGGYAHTTELEYLRLYRALQLDGRAAALSTSWGLFQILGRNWHAAGEATLEGFLIGVHHDEDTQLGQFVAFVQSQGLADELRRRDWAGFALHYNGANYAINHYDTKLEAAYHAARP